MQTVFPAHAEEEAPPQEELELIGDRPDFTESSAAIAPLHLQGELGVDYSTFGDDQVLTVPALLLRFGFVEHWEARLGLPSYEASFVETEDGSSETDHDVSGVELGAKGAFDLSDRFALGVLPFVVLPLYGDAWDASGMELGLKGLWAFDLNETFSLGGNLGVVVGGVAAEGDIAVESLVSLSLGIALTQRLGMFAEVYALISDEPEVAPVADGGFTFLITPRFQVDLYGGVGFLEASRGFNAGCGAIFLI